MQKRLYSIFLVAITMVFPFKKLSDYEVKFTPEQEMFREFIREFAEKEVAPRVQFIEENDQVPEDLLKRMAELGFQGLAVPTEYGGQGGNQVTVSIFSEEVARVCPALTALVGVNGLFVIPILLFGSEEQKKRYVVPVAKGEKKGAHATTEAVAGSDVAGIQTKAEKVGNVWKLNGRKAFISGGDIADYFVVLARTSPPPSKKERWKGLTFFIVEKEGEGFKIAMETYDHGRIGVAAQALGITQALFEKSLNYSLQRYTFERPLIQYQMIDSYLADMTMKLVSARHLVYWAATLADQTEKNT